MPRAVWGPPRLCAPGSGAWTPGPDFGLDMVLPVIPVVSWGGYFTLASVSSAIKWVSPWTHVAKSRAFSDQSRKASTGLVPSDLSHSGGRQPGLRVGHQASCPSLL